MGVWFRVGDVTARHAMFGRVHFRRCIDGSARHRHPSADRADRHAAAEQLAVSAARSSHFVGCNRMRGAATCGVATCAPAWAGADIACDRSSVAVRTPRPTRSARFLALVLLGLLPTPASEYHTMVDFVRPQLLGSPAEFEKNFVAPIIAGQAKESTARGQRARCTHAPTVRSQPPVAARGRRHAAFATTRACASAWLPCSRAIHARLWALQDARTLRSCAERAHCGAMRSARGALCRALSALLARLRSRSR